MVLLAKEYGIRPWEYELVHTDFIQAINLYNYAYPPDEQDYNEF